MQAKIFASAFAGAFWTSPLLADVGGAGSGEHMHWMGNGWSHGLFGPLMMIIAVVALVAIVVAVVRAINPQGTPAHDTQPSALDILKARFARGEIDQTEFDSRRRSLES